MGTKENLEIFCSYVHEDKQFFNALKLHLMPLQRQSFITVWADTEIKAGQEWEKEIKQHLDKAKIILLLVSPDFIASDYCSSVEMEHTMERHKAKEVLVIPIILRYADWQSTPFGNLQALPLDGKPIMAWEDRDAAFLSVTTGIRTAIEEFFNELNKLQASNQLETPIQKTALEKVQIYDYSLDQNMLELPKVSSSEGWEKYMRTCFVILPFGKTTDKHDEAYWTQHFETVIKPAVEKATDGRTLLGYKALLANPPGGGIIENVFQNLQSADVVLADLTDFNPNVVYELAIRQCLHDRTIVILEKGLEPPFYFKDYKIISYSTATYQEVDQFKEDIQRSLLNLTYNNSSASDNPILDYFRKTGQIITIQFNQINNILPLGRDAFTAIYVPETNNQRNASKRRHIQDAKKFIRLLASSGHAYLAWIQSPFRDILEERLKAGIPVQIILINPWSESRVWLSLGQFANSAPDEGSIQAIALDKINQGELTGFDPVALIEQSINYREKYSTSIRGYQDFRTRFGDTIELRICTIAVTSTILLTENSGFFEPYIYVPDERMLKAMITFEVEFPGSSYFYRHCRDYFEILWQLSIPYEKFVTTEDDRKRELRENYGWKTDSPGSTA
jgi:hypothetical protein